MKVLRANLVKKDRNQVTLAVRTFKERKAEDTAKELLDEKIQTIKEKNENRNARVAQRRAVLEAQKEKKRRELAEKERREMTPMYASS